jgi:hypothetical protein
MSYHGRSLSGLGAVTQTAAFDYEAKARELATFNGGSYVFVGLGRDGANPQVVAFPTADALRAKFDGTSASSKLFWAGMFDKATYADDSSIDPLLDSKSFQNQVFINTTVTNTLETLKNLAPYIIGGAVLIGGVLYFTRSGSKSKTPAKKRRRASAWRRRVTTVWR